MSRLAAPRAMALLVGGFWVGAGFAGTRLLPAWALYLGVVTLVALAAAPRLLRDAKPVRMEWPALATGLALISLAAVLIRDDERFPDVERSRFAVLGLAHALSFLLALRLAPSRNAEGPSENERVDAAWRRGLMIVFLATILAQVVAMALQWSDGADRLLGSYGNPNVLGATLAACGIGFAALRRWRGWAWPVIVLALGLLLMTGSRGALLALVISVVCFAWRHGGRKTIGWVLLGLLLVAVIPNPLRERALALRPQDNYSRPFLWSCALEEITEQPLGIGPGMNKHVFPARAFDPERPWLLHQRHAVGLTHNVFLTLTLEWGWLAGAAALGLVVLAVRRRLAARGDDPLGQACTLSALILFLELQVDGLEQNPMAFSFFLVLAAVALRRCAPATPSFSLSLSSRVAGVALLIVSLSLGAAGVERYARARSLDAARVAVRAWNQAEGSFADARLAVRGAQERAPNEPGAHRERLQLEMSWLRDALERDPRPEDWRAVAAEAVGASAAALQADPADAELRAEQAQLARLLSRFSETEADREAFFDRYRRAMLALLERDPLDTEARLRLAQEAQRVGRRDVFEQQMDHLFQIEPDHAFGWYLRGVHDAARGEKEAALYALVRAREAVFNARIKQGLPSPRASQAYQRILARVDLNRVRALIWDLRRELYF